MRPSQMEHDTANTDHIVAQPPFDPKEPRQTLQISRTRVWIGVILLISGFAIGSSSSLLPAAKPWIGVIALLLILSSFFVLDLYRSRSRRQDPRKLYGHQRI